MKNQDALINDFFYSEVEWGIIKPRCASGLTGGAGLSYVNERVPTKQIRASQCTETKSSIESWRGPPVVWSDAGM